LLAVLALGAIATGTGVAVAASAANGLTAVPFANPRATGIAAPPFLAPELAQIALVGGSQPLQNGTPRTRVYGLSGDAPPDLARADKDGTPLPKIDGATWAPWAKRLLFIAELGAVVGGVWQATPDFPSTVEDISGVLGRGGYEGIQNDSAGNLYVVEDVGGAK